MRANLNGKGKRAFMDSLQKQLDILGSKVDGLYQLIDQLTGRVSDIVTECKLSSDQDMVDEVGGSHSHHRAGRSPSNFEQAMEHKDVLFDGDGLEATMQTPERQLSPEIQIQRLTAQLTAAYSRIAALEEQLISKRIH
jgi:hypothetical protein